MKSAKESLWPKVSSRYCSLAKEQGGRQKQVVKVKRRQLAAFRERWWWVLEKERANEDVNEAGTEGVAQKHTRDEER